MKVQSFADGEGVEDGLGVPVGGGPVEGLSGFNDFMKAATDLFEGCEIVVEMRVDDIDVVELQSFE